MTKDDIINTCKFIAQESNVPFESLWFDDSLTVVGAISVIILYCEFVQMTLKYIKSKQ